MGFMSRIRRALSPRNTYEGAQRTRRLSGWRTTDQTIDALLKSQGEKLRQRARYLVRNNAHASNACEAFVAAAVGIGIKPSCLVADPALKDLVQRTWLQWTDEADADGLTDFYGLQALAVRAMFEAGEVFIRFRPRRPTDGLTVPLQVQLLESEMLPFAKNETLAGGNRIVCGIEVDAIGRRVAYHFLRSHPGDVAASTAGETVRVPAEQVLHVFKPLRPGQLRGQPWITPAIVRLYLLDLYDDAELDRKRTAALFAGFVIKPDPDGTMFSGTDTDADDTPIAGLQPGTMTELPLGWDVKFSEPADVGGAYELFQYRNLTAAAAAMGIPYAAMTGDLRQVNYSSIRAGLVEWKRRVEQFQHETLVFQACRPIWRRWVETAALAGVLPLDRAAELQAAVKWMPPKWEWVDPAKDVRAELEAIAGRLKSRSDAIEETGEDPEEVDRRIAADLEREKRLGIPPAPAPAASTPPAVEPNETEEPK